MNLLITMAGLASALFAGVAFADPLLCVSGNLSTVDGTTCDIGHLQFTFTTFFSYVSTGIPQLTSADFTFTVLSDGFELSGPPPQTVSSTGFPNASENVGLNFDVTDLDGIITGIGVTGGNLSASGPNYADAENSLNICSINGCSEGVIGGADNDSYDQNGVVSNFSRNSTLPFSSGYGTATPFQLIAYDGTASVDSTATYFTFNAPLPVVPEPRLFVPTSIGFLGLCIGLLVKTRRRSG